jgi:hypothetical protein
MSWYPKSPRPATTTAYLQMSNDSSDPPMNIGTEIAKGAVSLATSLLPIAALYLIGWVYLSVFLRQFGINLPELGFDIPTILIYSFDPISAIVQFALWMIVVITITIGVLLFLDAIFLDYTVAKSRHQPPMSYAPIVLTFLKRPLIYLTIILMTFYLMLIGPVVWLAHASADRIWRSQQATTVLAAAPMLEVKRSDVLLSVARSADNDGSAGVQETINRFIAVNADYNYEWCREMSALHAVIAAPKVLYLICLGDAADQIGSLFEIRDGALVSYRYVRRN